MKTENLLTKVKQHHYIIEKLLPENSLVMTVLIGSNNYGLDTAKSDIDTFTFILPSFRELALAEVPKSGEYEVEDGKCMYKDIRLAFNLLKKTSPNSVECFLSKYKYEDPRYQDILDKYLKNEKYLNYMVHCNYYHMLDAMAGMACQLTKRNMAPGKRYSHALRLWDMSDKFLMNRVDLLDLSPYNLQTAYSAKCDVSAEHDSLYEMLCDSIAGMMARRREDYILTDEQIVIESEGMKLVLQFQEELMEYYIYNIMK